MKQCMDSENLHRRLKKIIGQVQAIDHVFAGVIALSDALRSDSKQVISRLNQLGVVPVLLTGDHTIAANQIAEEAGIKEVYASCLPEDKL